MAKLKVLLTGAQGQLGLALQAVWPSGIELIALSHSELAIDDIAQVSQVFLQYKPHVVINCAAFTQVDLAEEEIDQAYDANDIGVANLVRACAKKNIKLLHISTDFVFSGVGCAWDESTIPAPLTIYGQSKLAGEAHLKKLQQNGLILRTSWLFSSYGKNFVKTILAKLQRGEALSVVQDQIGSPTSAHFLAQRILLILPLFWQGKLHGIYHQANFGQCSWYEFAQEIAVQGAKLGLLDKDFSIQPITSSQWPQKAPRPGFSALNSSRLDAIFGMAPSWQEALQECLRLLPLQKDY